MSYLKPIMFELVSKPDGPAAINDMLDTLQRLQEELLNYDGAVALAIKNFIGVLQFYLDGTQEAMDCFDQVLDADPDNINAIQNCIFVYRKMMKDSDVNRLESKLSHLLEGNGNKAKEVTARFHAEQGYVMSFEFNFDQNTEVIDFKRFQEAKHCFEKAFSLCSPDIFSLEESCQWRFFAARTCFRLDVCCSLTKTDLTETEIENILVRAISLSHYVLKNSESDTYKSKAWCLLGTAMFKRNTDKNGNRVRTQLLETCIEECGFSSEYEDPSLCFEAAVRMCPGDAKLVCRYARMFLGPTFRDLPRAIQLLNKSIEMDASKVNWLAFASRGEARRELYKDQEYKHRVSRPENRELLEMALTDFQSSEKFKSVLRRWIDLGEVCHMLGRSTCSQPLDKRMMDRALCHFSKAIESLKGRKHPNLHFKRGNCLKDYGDARGAIESYKTAMECEESPACDVFLKAFKKLMVLLLQKCREDELPPNLISEVASTFDYGFRKRHEKISPIVKKCCSSFAREMFAVCRELMHKQNYSAVRFLLPTLTDALRDIARDCRRCGETDIALVVERDLHHAEKMNESLASVERQAADLSNLSLSDNDGEGAATAAATASPTNKLQEGQRADLKDSTGHPAEIARNAKN